jgi:hypothetical protein
MVALRDVLKVEWKVEKMENRLVDRKGILKVASKVVETVWS